MITSSFAKNLYQFPIQVHLVIFPASPLLILIRGEENVGVVVVVDVVVVVVVVVVVHQHQY